MVENNKNTNESSLIDRIAQQYGEYRKTVGRGQKGYPLELQRLALSALEYGCPVLDVAKVAGVSTHSIYVWRARERGGAAIKPAKQLKLTPEVFERTLGNSCAKIRLKSGIAIEVPFFALTGELLTLLSQVKP